MAATLILTLTLPPNAQPLTPNPNPPNPDLALTPNPNPNQVGVLKRWLHQRTGVPPSRQRLLGLARRGEAAEEAPLRERTLAPAPTSTIHPVPHLYLALTLFLTLSRTLTPGQVLLGGLSLPAGRTVTLLGTPDAEVAAAEQALQRARSVGRFIKNDLGAPAARNEHALATAAAAVPRRRSHGTGSRIDPGRGSGVWLDPALWAEPAPPSEYRTNPNTRRLERLELGNALLGRGGVREGGGAAADLPPPRDPREEIDAPPNVDLLGQARGGCTACTRCPGYERREPGRGGGGGGGDGGDGGAPRWAENDVEMLRCRRCGCFNHEHAVV